MSKIYIFDITKEKDWNSLENKIPLSFLEHCEKYKTERAYHLSLAAYYMLFCYLEEKGVNKKYIEYKQDSYEKPFIKGTQFNIAHSYNLSVLYVSDTVCGVDVEMIRKDKDYSKLATLIYPENKEYRPLEDNQAFVELWSKKEAKIKYIGTGIKNNPLKEVKVDDTKTLVISDVFKNEYALSYLNMTNEEAEIERFNF